MEMITREDRDALKARLDALIDNRPRIAARIAEARELGDLKENAEYHSVREQQGMEEAEIDRLQKRLASAIVTDPNMKSDMIVIGSTFKVREVGSDEDELFRLVGEASGASNLDYTEATVSSPFGEAFLKARVGDTVPVRGPRGVKKFEIKEIL
jgi:transcription elongation factor GreA